MRPLLAFCPDEVLRLAHDRVPLPTLGITGAEESAAVIRAARRAAESAREAMEGSLSWPTSRLV